MRALFALLLLLTVALASAPALAEEQILAFDSTVRVETDGSLLVEERITVNAEGRNIRRGIFRDFPTIYAEAGGVRRDVGFDLLEVLRDGAREPSFTESVGRGIRIYIGDEDTLLRPGRYTYTIRYRTTRQLRHFADYDELYWNVTGNFWDFPILRAIGRIELPEGARVLQKAAYTGAQGDTGRDYRVVSESGREIVFETTRSLRPREGFTVAVAFPKGLVPEPGPAGNLLWLLWDNIGFLVLGAGTALTMLYYVSTWTRIGRDPERGIVIPLFAPPKNLSPAAVSYVHYQGFGGATMRAFIAAILSLAVKGRLRIDAEDEDKTALIPVNEKTAPLPGGERVIVQWFLNGRDRFEFTKENGPHIASGQAAFRSAILKEHEGVFFNTNSSYLVIGVLLSIGSLAFYLIFQTPPDGAGVGTIFGFLLGAAGAFVLSMGWRRILGWLPGGGSRLLGILLALLGTVVMLLALFTLFTATDALSAIGTALAILLGVANVAFFHLLRAPTLGGRKVMDDIEGFRLYLSVAEAERMNLVGGPEMSPQLFEKYLPYAVALGVEKPWSEAFEAWLKRSVPTGAGSRYHPRWYKGDSWNTQSLGRATAAVVSGMATGMASAMPTKSSSGSGGGGFSGGGGGGGGGGGW